MSATKYLKVIAHILKMERIITLYSYSSRFQPAREAQDKVVEQWQRSKVHCEPLEAAHKLAALIGDRLVHRQTPPPANSVKRYMQS